MKHFLAFLLLAVPNTFPNQLLFRADGATQTRQMGAKLGDIVSVKDPHGSSPGAVGDGTTDDTTAIQAAITAGAGGIVDFPAPSVSYKVTGTLSVSASGTMLRGNHSKIYMAHTDSGPTGGILFNVTASNVDMDGLWIDSTGSTTGSATINHYPVRFQGSSGTHLTNVRVRNSWFTALPWTFYPPGGVGTPFGTHAMYAQYVDGFTAQNNVVNAVGGAAVYASVVTKLNVLDNDINDTGWYSIQLNDQVNGALIRGNSITGTAAQARLWGGSVNLMSNSTTGGACGSPGCARIKNVEIAHNHISGAHSYTAAIHIESSSYVSLHDNTIEGIYLTQPSDFYSNPTPPNYVRVYVRPVSAGVNEGPNDHISFENDSLTAFGIQNIGIYADAQDNGSGTLTYSDSLSVSKEKIISLDSSNYFQHAIIVHGQQGGWKNISIVNNPAVSGFPDASSPVSGLIGVIATSVAPNINTQILSNNLNVVGGVSSTTTHLGIAVDAYTQGSQVSGNALNGFWDGIRTFTNASAYQPGPNLFSGIGHSNYTNGVAPTVAEGTSPRYGALILTGRGSNLAASSVVSLAPAGEYRVCATARTTTSGTGTTATLNIVWQDEGGAKTDLVGTWALNALDVTGQINKCEYIHSVVNANIQVSVTAGTYGSSLYAISATAEKLN